MQRAADFALNLAILIILAIAGLVIGREIWSIWRQTQDFRNFLFKR